MTKQRQLADIKQQIINAHLTPSLAEQATQLVFGEGNPDAELVLIGEAPGKHEDEAGRPFVGAAGKFLNEMLDMIGLGRPDIYITNIVKYRPPNNRDPLPAEKRAFWPYLQAQLAVIRPKVVATLGRHSLHCFLPELSISRCHGQPKRLKIQLPASDGVYSLIILPLFHPAAALYNASLRQTLIDDFAKIPRVLEQAIPRT